MAYRHSLRQISVAADMVAISGECTTDETLQSLVQAIDGSLEHLDCELNKSVQCLVFNLLAH